MGIVSPEFRIYEAGERAEEAGELRLDPAK